MELGYFGNSMSSRLINEDEIGKSSKRANAIAHRIKEVDKQDEHTPRQHRLERHGRTYKPRYFCAETVPVSESPEQEGIPHLGRHNVEELYARG